MVRLLIVDDSAFMRNALSSMLSSDPEIKIVGTAKDGFEAIEKIEKLKPDVVTMDIDMPGMDGITALKHIMERNPLPVIMISSMTTEDARMTLDALDFGAVDFIPKNLSELSCNILKIREILIDKISQIAGRGPIKKCSGVCGAEYAPRAINVPPYPPSTAGGELKVRIVSVGASTGGPKALQQILPKIPKDFPAPIVIALHMPSNFTGPFAERLNQLSQIEVREAKEGETLQPGLALIAPGWGHMRVTRVRGKEARISISDNDEKFIFRPSVDALMSSVAECFPGRALGIILSGMGSDGLKGLTLLKKAGGRIFAQNEGTCIVYGMPKSVVQAGIADKVLHLDDIAEQIVNLV